MRKELKRYSSIGNRAGILLLCRKVLTGNIEDLSSIGASCSFINGIDLNFKCGIIAFEEIKLISIVDNKCQAKDILYSHEDENLFIAQLCRFCMNALIDMDLINIEYLKYNEIKNAFQIPMYAFSMECSITNIVKVCSKYPSWQSEIDRIKLKETIDPDNASYVIISTYASFVRDKVFKEFATLPKKRLLLIADEAHNMGSGRILDKLDGIPFLRRIGLSATPERQFDDAGTARLYEFFGASDKFTFEYTMQEAIDNGFLCRYYYYPHIVRLTDAEMAEYMKISLKLAKMYNNSRKDFKKSDDILKILLLKRKHIIHKAINKEKVFRSIIHDRFVEKGDLKYTLVYVPEGNRPDDNNSDIYDDIDIVQDDDFSNHIIDKFTRIVQEVSPTTTVKKFTSDSTNRDEILTAFANGDLEVLTSMKCLDEGVDIPRSELAIFCASTGNPRQFIQRRGRILRTHKDKKFAYIHDLVVVPEVSSAAESFNMERNLLAGEIRRVKDFALLSENAYSSVQELDDILEYYNLSIF